MFSESLVQTMTLSEALQGREGRGKALAQTTAGSEADTERERKRNSKKEEDKRQGGEREENKRTQKPQVKTFLNPFSSHLKFYWIKVESLSSLGDEKLVLVGKFQFSSILPMINEPCMHSICCGI